MRAIKGIGTSINEMSRPSARDRRGGGAAGRRHPGNRPQRQQAAQGATQVTGRITEVNRGAADTGTAAGQVHGLAVSLLAESNHLSAEVESFLQTIRVA